MLNLVAHGFETQQSPPQNLSIMQECSLSIGLTTTLMAAICKSTDELDIQQIAQQVGEMAVALLDVKLKIPEKHAMLLSAYFLIDR